MAELVITGEGHFDSQSINGKVADGIAGRLKIRKFLLLYSPEVMSRFRMHTVKELPLFFLSSMNLLLFQRLRNIAMNI